MRSVSNAICTSAEPVSCSVRPCFLTISSFSSLARVIAPPVNGLRSPSSPRKEGRARPGLRSRTRVATMVSGGVAAGHAATADAAFEILQEGGSAADAAVAGCLASCVAETVMTGLLGGGQAIYLDATSGRTANLDCFVAMPGLGRERREVAVVELEVPFGSELVHYAVGIGSCGVPGVAAGLDALWSEHGRLPWPRLVEPALRLARDSVPMP